MLKGYSGVNLIHGLTHLDTEYETKLTTREASLLWGSPMSRLPSAVESRSSDIH